MWNDFKAFLMRGNVLDLAVGIIIGAAFSKIVGSFVSDIITPLMSVALGNIDLFQLLFCIKRSAICHFGSSKSRGSFYN